jgi:hypothetical protein
MVQPLQVRLACRQLAWALVAYWTAGAKIASGVREQLRAGMRLMLPLAAAFSKEPPSLQLMRGFSLQANATNTRQSHGRLVGKWEVIVTAYMAVASSAAAAPAIGPRACCCTRRYNAMPHTAAATRALFCCVSSSSSCYPIKP